MFDVVVSTRFVQHFTIYNSLKVCDYKVWIIQENNLASVVLILTQNWFDPGLAPNTHFWVNTNTNTTRPNQIQIHLDFSSNTATNFEYKYTAIFIQIRFKYIAIFEI